MTTKDANRLRPSAGDTVRVTFESVYRPVWDAPEDGWLVLAEFEGAPWYVRPTEPTRRITSVEVLPPPEPAATSAAASVRADRGPLPGYSPAVGDRVRIVLEGEVHKIADADGAYLLGSRGETNWIVPTAPHVVSVEKLPDPEQQFAAGDVAALGNRTYLRDTEGWWHSEVPMSAALNDDYMRGWIDDPKRPLRLLVRGGESVAAGLGEK